MNTFFHITLLCLGALFILAVLFMYAQRHEK